MLVYACLYIEYIDNCSTVSKLNVYKNYLLTTLLLMLLMLENKMIEKIKCCNTYILVTCINMCLNFLLKKFWYFASTQIKCKLSVISSLFILGNFHYYA